MGSATAPAMEIRRREPARTAEPRHVQPEQQAAAPSTQAAAGVDEVRKPLPHEPAAGRAGRPRTEDSTPARQRQRPHQSNDASTESRGKGRQNREYKPVQAGRSGSEPPPRDTCKARSLNAQLAPTETAIETSGQPMFVPVHQRLLSERVGHRALHTAQRRISKHCTHLGGRTGTAARRDLSSSVEQRNSDRAACCDREPAGRNKASTGQIRCTRGKQPVAPRCILKRAATANTELSSRTPRAINDSVSLANTHHRPESVPMSRVGTKAQYVPLGVRLQQDRIPLGAPAA